MLVPWGRWVGRPEAIEHAWFHVPGKIANGTHLVEIEPRQHYALHLRKHHFVGLHLQKRFGQEKFPLAANGKDRFHIVPYNDTSSMVRTVVFLSVQDLYNRPVVWLKADENLERRKKDNARFREIFDTLPMR